MRRAIARLALLAVAAAGLAGCADSGGKLGSTLKSEYIASPDIKTILADKVTRVAGANALGVHASLVGSRAQTAQALGSNVVLDGSMPVPDVQHYLEGIRDRLFAHWPYPDARLPRVEVLATLNYNAEAIADDTIQIPLGIIERAESEDEVAFVVGHEMGHLLLNHQIRRENQLYAAENGAQVVAALAMVGAMLATGKRTGNVINIQETPALISMGSAMAGQTAVAEVITAIIDPGWSSRQEEQADLVGEDLMTAAGYNPAAASDAFTKIIADEHKAQQEAQRISKQAEEVRKNQPATLSLVNAFDDLTSSLEDRLNKLRANHPSTEDRDRSLTDYRNNVYPAQSDRPVQSKALLALKRRYAVRSAMRAIRELREADKQLGDNAPAAALRSAATAERLVPNWWAPPYMIALADLNLDRRPAALAALARATRTNGAPYDAYERFAHEWMAQKNYRAALNVLDAADRRFGTKELTWPDRIVVLRYMNNQAAADQVLKNCRNSGNPRLREACGRAAARTLEVSANLTPNTPPFPGAG